MCHTPSEPETLHPVSGILCQFYAVHPPSRASTLWAPLVQSWLHPVFLRHRQKHLEVTTAVKLSQDWNAVSEWTRKAKCPQLDLTAIQPLWSNPRGQRAGRWLFISPVLVAKPLLIISCAFFLTALLLLVCFSMLAFPFPMTINESRRSGLVQPTHVVAVEAPSDISIFWSSVNIRFLGI